MDLPSRDQLGTYIVRVTMRNGVKVSTFRIDDIDVGIILYAGIEGDPSSIGDQREISECRPIFVSCTG